MGLQETSDILITFFQNIVLLLDIPNVNIKWPAEIKEPMEYVQAIVDLDFLQTLASIASEKAKELDVHIMLILKNALIPFVVSVLAIVPLKRWYYVTWWLIALFFAIAFATLTSVMSFFAQKPFDMNWLTSLHYQVHLYYLSYVPNKALDAGDFSVGATDSTFDPVMVGLFSAAVALAFILFFVTVGIGIILWAIRLYLERRRFNQALNNMKAKAPAGKKVNVAKLRYRMVYEQVKAKQAEELDLKLRNYWTRIAPLFLILLGEVIAVAALIWMKDYLDNTSPNATLNSWVVYAVCGIALVSLCFVSCCFIGCNSLILFEKMRKIIFKINNFVTSKSLKLTFLILSSLYIPLAVSIFSMLDCAQVTCDAGNVFTNRKDDIAASAYFTRLLEQLIRSPEICTSCQFNMTTSNIHLHGSTATGYTQCSADMMNSLCPGGTESRLLRQPSISCTEIYPYVAASAGMCCLFVVTTPFLIFYLIKRATKQLGSVEIPHLLKYHARKLRRRFKNRLEKSQKRKVDPDELPSLENFLHNRVYSGNKNQKRGNIIQRIVSTNHVADLAWEIRIALVDCSIESLYFPFKYKWRYFKLLFLLAKVVLSFTNVFGVTIFGTQPQDNTIGPQLVLWVTLAVQAFLGSLALVIRPHMIFAETLLMVVCSISICANCIFGLVLVYTGVEAPAWVALSFMAINSIILLIAAIMSVVFYVYRLRKNNWKTVQSRMKRLLKARHKKDLQQAAKRRKSIKKGGKAALRAAAKQDSMLSPEQVTKYWSGLGRKKREPYLDLDMTENAGKYLREIKSAQKYQRAVAYSLNRTSLDTLINFFFFLSIITSIAGILLVSHYVFLFLNPSYVDPYLQTRMNVFTAPLNVNDKGSWSISDFSSWAVTNMDTSDSTLLRNETETAMESQFHFAEFPSSFCRAAYNYTFAGYDNWEEFTDNCCCTRDLAYEGSQAERTDVYFRNLEVEQWRCNNGLIKRHVRSMDVQFSAVVSNSFLIGGSNFVDNFVTLDGYAMRGFCDKEFKSGFSLPHSKSADCSGKKDVHEYREESGLDADGLTTIEEMWTDPMVIRAYVTNSTANLFEGTTELIPDETVQNREFYGVVWDSVKSIIARTLLY